MGLLLWGRHVPVGWGVGRAECVQLQPAGESHGGEGRLREPVLKEGPVAQQSARGLGCLGILGLGGEGSSRG